MALEGFLYGDAPDGNELRELLVRTLVACEDEEGWKPVAAGLAEAYGAWLDDTAEEESELMGEEPSDYTPDRGERLSGSAAWRRYHAAWCATYARRTGMSREDASESFCPATGTEEAVCELTLPKGVIRDAARAVAAKDAARARAWAKMFEDERRAAEAREE